MWNADWFYCFLMKKSSFVSEINILPFPNLIYTLDNKLKLLKPVTSFHYKLAQVVETGEFYAAKREYPFIWILKASWDLVRIHTFLHEKHQHTHHTSSCLCSQKRQVVPSIVQKTLPWLMSVGLGLGISVSLMWVREVVLSTQWEKCHWWKNPTSTRELLRCF